MGECNDDFLRTVIQGVSTAREPEGAPEEALLLRAEAAYRAVIALPWKLGPELCALMESQYDLAGALAGLRAATGITAAGVGEHFTPAAIEARMQRLAAESEAVYRAAYPKRGTMDCGIVATLCGDIGELLRQMRSAVPAPPEPDGAARDKAVYVRFAAGLQGTRLTVTEGHQGPVLATVQFTRKLDTTDEQRVNAAVRAVAPDRSAIVAAALDAAAPEGGEHGQ